MTFEPTDNMCALLLVGMPCATTSVTKFEKGGKAYVERVPESELGFEHLTESEDMVIS